MSTRGRHPEAGDRRANAPADAHARSTWNSSADSMHAGGYGRGVQAGERLLGEIDKIQARLGDMSEDAGGGGPGGVSRLERLAMLGEISGFVAHEFNNILTPLLAHAQVALRQPRDPERMALVLERVVETVKRATAVAESILDLAKQDRAGVSRETGVPPAAIQERANLGTHIQTRESGESDVARCVRRAVDEVGGEGAVVELQPGLRARMQEHDLQQVVLNLLLNARRANAARSAMSGSNRSHTDRIIVRGKAGVARATAQECSYIDRNLPELLRGGVERAGPAEQSDNNLCVIEIEDFGGGIGPEAARSLRSRGFKVIEGGGGGVAAVGCGASGREEGTGVGGSGLGLEICRRVVERAGGWIEIESRPGVGTIVRVHLRRVVGSARAA